MIKINKICILINWVREVDMYMNLIKKIPKEKLLILINDLNDKEIERKNENFSETTSGNLTIPNKAFSEGFFILKRSKSD